MISRKGGFPGNDTFLRAGGEILRKEIGQAYPDYAVLIIPDVDVSD